MSFQESLNKTLKKESLKPSQRYIPSWIEDISEDIKAVNLGDDDSSGFVSPTGEDSLPAFPGYERRNNIERRRSIAGLTEAVRVPQNVTAALSADQAKRHRIPISKSTAWLKDEYEEHNKNHIEEELTQLLSDDTRNSVSHLTTTNDHDNDTPNTTPNVTNSINMCKGNPNLSTTAIKSQKNKISNEALTKLNYKIRAKSSTEYEILQSKSTKYTTTYSMRNKSKQSLKTVSKKHKFIETGIMRKNEVGHTPKSYFKIPELPHGTLLEFKIHSTWGDDTYVGLNGIEIFNDKGTMVTVKKIWIEPDDLENRESKNLKNIIDGRTRTRDSNHLWITKMTSRPYIINLLFTQYETLSLLRVWNYNKSRIHTTRGVRLVQIFLDTEQIFFGEIAQASGELSGLPSAFGDTILFTTKDTILEQVFKNDQSFREMMADESADNILELTNRPSTQSGVKKETENIISKTSQIPLAEEFVAKTVEIVLLSNWGQNNLIGLTGIEVFNNNGKQSVSSIFAYNSYDGKWIENVTDIIPCQELIDNQNITTDIDYMWCCNHKEGTSSHIVMSLEESVVVSGVRIWNYNNNLDFSYAGAKQINIHLDGVKLNNAPILLRRAPGNTNYDYVQEIMLAAISVNNKDAGRENDPFASIPQSNNGLPVGFVYEFVIYSTWGDTYYVGLNGIEMIGINGKPIQVTESNVCAQPVSINVTDSTSHDVRLPAKLCDGINTTRDGRNSWLAPILPATLNRIYYIFDTPVCVANVMIWNYGKTPSRGVKEFGVSGNKTMFNIDPNLTCPYISWVSSKNNGNVWSLAQEPLLMRPGGNESIYLSYHSGIFVSCKRI